VLTKRIIPCLDIKDGRTVKGVNFVGLRDAGDPVELAKRYAQTGADELVFLDITATIHQRRTLLPLVEKIARHINIPFTVGGGINSLSHVKDLLRAGADKVAINSAAIQRPQLINELSTTFGNQCIVLAVDAQRLNHQWTVFLAGGRIPTQLNLFNWVPEAVSRGAGEILFTSINNDGTRLGFANQALHQLHQLVNVPLIASGGAGTMQHFADAFTLGHADAALAASVFHDQDITIPNLKQYLSQQQIPIRLNP
jgi:imidazole glycerol-phosphate synthase subunit HisF